jgi:hypothetical protein
MKNTPNTPDNTTQTGNTETGQSEIEILRSEVVDLVKDNATTKAHLADTQRQLASLTKDVEDLRGWIRNMR